eukprot:PhM_4_TR17816/c0_g1_i1/m.30305/K09571/FKBP4_5; FK506-binding protein 4/5
MPETGTPVRISYDLYDAATAGGVLLQSVPQLDITLGAAHVVPWLDTAVQGLEKAGDTCEASGPMTISGYRPNTEMRARVTLVKIHSDSFDYSGWEMPAALTQTTMERLKKEGNERVGEGEYAAAVGLYKRALRCARRAKKNDTATASQPPAHLADIVRACRLNSALCHLNLKEHKKCIYHCDRVLRDDDQKSNVKALFRRGMAHYGMDAYDAAERDLRAVLVADAANADAQKALEELTAKKAAHEKKKRRRCFRRCSAE